MSTVRISEVFPGAATAARANESSKAVQVSRILEVVRWLIVIQPYRIVKTLYIIHKTG
jgi:hypothetical protein